jgi:hypothetical protein
MRRIVRRVASNTSDAMKMLTTVALGIVLVSHIASAAEKPVYLSCHGKKTLTPAARAPDLDSYISIVIDGAKIIVEPANEAIKLATRLVNDDDFVTFKYGTGETSLHEASIKAGYLNKITGEAAVEIAMPGTQPGILFDGICKRAEKLF